MKIAMPKIISLGFAVPENSYTQEETFEKLGYPRRFKRLFTQSGIDKRHFWVPLERITHLSWQEQQEEYAKGAVALSKQAILNCLDGRDVSDIGCLVFASCTGFCPGPVVPHYLADELGFKPDTYFTNIGSMGCEGGYPGLKRATDFTIASGKKSLVVACELASCSYFPEPAPDPENHFELARSNAIFADAASAALVGFDEEQKHPTIIDTETHTDTQYLGDLGYVWRDGRLRVRLSRRVPEIAAKLAKIVVGRLLDRHQMAATEHWVIHAAGNIVLDNIRTRIGIPEIKLSLSRKVLKLYGNCSSATIGIIGKLMMQEAKLREGDRAVVVSLGPGMTAGATLLRF